MRKFSKLSSLDKTEFKKSFLQELLEQKRVDKHFCNTLDSFTLEEIIRLKLELSTRLTKGRLLPTMLFRNLFDIVAEAMFMFVHTNCDGVYDACFALGVRPEKYGRYLQFFRFRREAAINQEAEITPELMELIKEIDGEDEDE